MSKTDKLDRMKNTVLETTGLTYTPGGTIELNFTPDVTDTGVSVPLVIGGISPTSISTDLTNYPNLGGPISGYPYAQLVDKKPKNVNGGSFLNSASSNSDRRYSGGNSIGGTNFYWRVRDIQTTVIDEIGIITGPANNISADNQGNYLSLPVGTYQADLSMTFSTTAQAIGIIYNHTSQKILTATFVNSYSNSGNQYIVPVTSVKGRFKINNEDDKIIILHACHTSNSNNYGFGFQSQDNLGNQFGNMYLNLELWKIR